MDLEQRTLLALDWDRVRDRLAQSAQTTRGAEAARALRLAGSVAEVHARYAEVDELMTLFEKRERPPVHEVRDIALWVREAQGGGILDGALLIEIAGTLAALQRLRAWVGAKGLRAMGLVVEPIIIDAALVDQLERSFDAAGELDGETWPKLGAIRSRVNALKARLREELERLAFGEELQDALQDRYITEREGRWVLPVKAAFRRGVGILHGHSQTGETAYVEPAQTVELQNDVRDADAALTREIRRILAELSRMVAGAAEAILAALDAAAQVDLALARAELGATWRGVVPKVGTDGVIKLQAARHPVLALRGASVVPNDLALDTPQPCLVLTGLNAGGKTVLLKTLGLAALLVRAGVPVPAAPGARVDFFPVVLADVGDLQSVESDVSTFSGHVTVLRTVIERAAPGTLVLLDEVAVGTDPAQGAALARAVLEALLDRGARVVLTTHYPELKGIDDARITVGAMEHEAGRPTYRLLLGAPGASHALAIARQMGVPAAVIDRARELLDARARELEDQAERLRAERERVERQARVIEAKLAEIEARELRLAEQTQRAQEAAMEGFRTGLRAQEEKVRGMVAALQADPSLRDATRTLEAIRAAAKAAAPVTPPPAAPKPLRVGQRVWSVSLGQSGELLSIDGARAQVRMRSMVVKVDLADLRPVDQKDAPPPMPVAAPIVEDQGAAVRTSLNTCDLRGMRFDEAMLEVESFVDGLSARGIRTGYILHGHGTGALKQGVRGYLPRCGKVRTWRPAHTGEGGDAFTVIEVA